VKLFGRLITEQKRLENKKPADGDTIFRIGSVTKVFTVIMLYQLYEKGIIESLDDQISDYNSNFTIQNPFPGSPGITFREIAAQLSGMPREAPCIVPCNETTDTMLERIAQMSLILPP